MKRIAVLLLVGCAGGTPGARPHDMGVAQHEEHGRQHAAEAQQHEAQFDPEARAEAEHCSKVRLGGADAGLTCWTSVSNPTAQHLDEARRHQKMAADHRAASAALRDAEARACAGVSNRDRDMSPFAHREDIESVTVLEKRQGAVITFRAIPGMTVETLRRIVDCHLARNASLGHDLPEMSYCPLVPKGVTATVKAAGPGFAVEMRANDPTALEELIRRAQGLGSGPKG